VGDDGCHPSLSGSAAAGAQAQSAERKVQVIMDHQQVGKRQFKIAQQGSHRPTRLVHKSHWFYEHNLVAVKSALANHGFELEALDLDVEFICKFIDGKKAKVVPGMAVGWTWISQSDDHYG
jgi:hypothetical protein